MNASAALEKLLRDYEFKTVIDYGCGVGTPHRESFEEARKEWAGWDPQLRPTYMGEKRWGFDCVWLSHVCEHMENFDFEMNELVDPVLPLHGTYLNRGGILAITVPPLKHEIVGGHVNLFNAGLLLYRLALLGIDCSRAAVKSEGYDISVIVDNVDPKPVSGLRHDRGDIEKVAHLLPKGYNYHGFDGRIKELNW